MKAKVNRLFCIAVLTLFATVLRAEDSGWMVSPYDYQYDMTVYAKLVIDEADVSDYTNYEIGAFVGDECRGVGEINLQGGYTWVYLRVRSNSASGESVTFKVFDKTTGKVMRIEEKVDFTANGQVGKPSSPTTFTKANYTLGDVNDDGELDIADIQDLIEIILFADLSTASPACDFNGDGEIDIADLQELIEFILYQ